MWLKKIFKKKRKEKKDLFVAYLAKNANLHLPKGAEALRVRVRGYRCGWREGCPCPRDGKVHQELHRKEVKRRCFGCEYLETIYERR